METLTLKQLNSLLTTEPSVSENSVAKRKIIATALYLFSDVISLSLAVILSMVIRDNLFPGDVIYEAYYPVAILVLLSFPLFYFIRGLYPGFGKDVIQELRTLTYSTTIVFAILAAFTFFIKDAWEYSRFVYLFSWFLALVSVPLGRAFIRKLFGSKDWWGIPVIIIGAGNAGEKIINSLVKNKQMGLRPVIAVDDDVDRWGYVHNIPVVGGLEIIPDLIRKINIDHAIIAMPKVAAERQHEIIRKYSDYFRHTIVIPELFGMSSLWVHTKDIGGILGLEVQQNLAKRSNLIKKRFFDIILASILTTVTLPIVTIVAAIIKMDSRGSVFFKQIRMGRKDSRFNMVKFRTMHYDAERRLKELLAEDPELKEEYDIYHKLRNDPRMTRIGRFLRKYSLDELPQFWNVITGEMSLIGPRAYMPWEKIKMNGNEEVILKVKPGISGLWQVTDRNASSFEERNITDVYYIRNWSMFLDIYILARTIAVVVTGKSGY